MANKKPSAKLRKLFGYVPKRKPSNWKVKDGLFNRIMQEGRAPSKSDVKGKAKRAIDLWDSTRGW